MVQLMEYRTVHRVADQKEQQMVYIKGPNGGTADGIKRVERNAEGSLKGNDEGSDDG